MGYYDIFKQVFISLFLSLGPPSPRSMLKFSTSLLTYVSGCNVDLAACEVGRVPNPKIVEGGPRTFGQDCLYGIAKRKMGVTLK